jgi:hypothetical protein
MGKMGIRKVPLATGIIAGIGLFVVCVMQLMTGIINMAVIFGVAGVAVMELAVMVSVIHGKPMLLDNANQVSGASIKATNAASKPTKFTMVSHEQPSESMTGLFVAPQPSMGHMDLRMDTASSHRENTGIYIESEELMKGGRIQKLVYGSKNEEKKPKKTPAKKPEAKRLAKMVKVKAKSK